MTNRSGCRSGKPKNIRSECGSGTLVGPIFFELLSLFSLLFALLFSGSLKSISKPAYILWTCNSTHEEAQRRGDEDETTLRGLVWVSAALCSDALNRRHSQMIPKSRPAQPAPLPTASHTGWTPIIRGTGYQGFFVDEPIAKYRMWLPRNFLRRALVGSILKYGDSGKKHF